MAETAVTGQVSSAPKEGLKEKSVGFVGDTVKEMRKVNWPTRTELQEATLITLATCVVFSVFVFGVDKIFENLLRPLYNMI